MAGSAFSKPFGSVKQATPAFQREWATLQSSGVSVASLANGATQDLTLAPSSSDSYGTIYVWGLSLTTGSNAFQGGFLVDEDGKKYLGAVATQNGPFFIAYDTPIKITQNSKLSWLAVVSGSTALTTAVSIYYTTTKEEIA
jgi:hypothetical protein